ncbi:fibronectin type III domain-containing protein [Parasegetibacter sp. NRK P23]|uniref:fibronectin type III domain-containing protein n=1 Tax=Parasegetibacter sp. NRK P23 TaxID=2942999 RepID=UPI0020433EBC|nr:LamG-like jellyroll fold domain-containing protein [Parasegetibacter sp. NRK P23]MCM5527269.1 PA14 domain-containing protein [Parasegetibacter sp. NRK P23]
MKTFTRIFSLLAIVLCAALGNAAVAQTGVLNPDDPIVVYNPSAPPATPAYGTLAKWVKTNRVSFNTSSFKAYYYKGMAFRVKFPKSYKDSLGTGKKYPIFIFFHGIGEKGTIYDNEYQLYHGGQRFMNYVDNGSFDGFLLYPQTSSGSGAFNTGHFQNIKELIENYFVPEVNVDINRVIVDGLSGGGGATWQMLTNHTKLVAAGLPISAVSVADGDASKVQSLKWTPIWLFQGGLDKSPAPFTARGVVSNYRNAGSNISYTEYPNLGHGCWNQAWVEPQFIPFINKAHKANPWPLNGRTEYCPGDPINQVIGLTAGFDGYEWRKNGELIVGANSNTITATSVGVYSARIRRGTEWSPWSPIPVEIKLKGATVSPDIQAEAGTTRVIPAPDGTNSVQLFVPEGYASYQWVKDGSATVLGTSNTYVATSAGAYRVKVTEEFGCSSEFSNPFTVIDANGANGPSSASGVIATVLSKTSIKLDWNQSSNPAPGTNETGFEIYRSLSSGSGYTLIATTAADATGYTDTDLNSNTQYFYRVRAINLNGASATTDPVNGTTLSDIQAPSAPGSLSITGTTRNSVSLTWSESLDDVGVVAYDIYVNGVKFYETELTAFTVYNLQYGQSYNFKVQARDFAGNKSPFSSQVTGQPLLNGLNYKYYTFTGTWSNLPNFNDLDPVATGVVPNVTLAPRSQNDNFGFLWEGFINITQAGTYYFRTNSDDGSRLWLGSLGQTSSPYAFGTTSTVNNDGQHGSQNRESVALNLSVGVYPIAIGFFEQGGGEAMTVSWRTPSSGTSYVTIPNSAFSDPPVNNGSAPAVPSGLSANAVSYKRINLAWTDNSDNESGFEVWRSTNPADDYAIIGTSAANATTFVDTLGLDASTTYFYRLRAIGQYGESAFIPAVTTDAQAQWRFNGNLTDASGNGRTITGSNNPGYDANDKKEGSHALTFNGSNQHLDVATSSGDYIRGGYSSKSISFWMKSNSNTGNRVVVDFGGNDDGLAIRLDGNRLYAGAAYTNFIFVTRKSISAPYTSTDWNYVTVVYNANSLKLYINGVEVAADNNLGFNAIGETSNASRIGTVNSSNAFNTATGRFSGKLDDFVVFGKALTVSEIGQLMNDAYGKVFATTMALPPAPSAPTGLDANGTSTSSIAVTWADNANNEEKYELYRSTTANGVYVLLASLPANTTTYNDTALLSNAVFYYKVRAVNEGGHSAYSNEDSAATQNNAPTITAIDHQYMRFGTQLNLPVSATDADPETLTIHSTKRKSTKQSREILKQKKSPQWGDLNLFNDLKPD